MKFQKIQTKFTQRKPAVADYTGAEGRVYCKGQGNYLGRDGNFFYCAPVSSLHMCIHLRNSNELCTLNRYSLLYLNFISVKLIFKRKLECSPLGLSYFIQHLLVSLMKYFRKRRRKEGLMRHVYVSHFFNRREENYGKKFS